MKIMMFCGDDVNSRIVYSYLESEQNLIALIEDEPVKKKKILKSRIKRLGLVTVISQLIFMKVIVPILKLESKNRTKEILQNYNLQSVSTFPGFYKKISVNNIKIVSIVNKLKPDIIIVNGTRIISKQIISRLSIPILNLHVGITPQYRGVHGGYWALAKNDRNNCGVTLHFIDPGIDTGGIICQKRIEITKNDNFTTYPILQTIEGISCLKKALKNKNLQNLKATFVKDQKSRLYYHPTFLQYLKHRLFDNVK